jgi:phytoene desaturase
MGKEKKVGVIGAGLGGLASALRLAKLGFEVHIFEKNMTVGGKASEIFENSFRFDTGPSLLTMPFVVEELFSDVGENIADHLSIVPLANICKYFFDDRTIINAYINKRMFLEEIENKTLDKPIDIIKYLNYCKTIYDLTAELFLFNSLSEKRKYFNLKSFKTLLNINKIDAFRTMNEANSSFFKDEKTIQLFNRYATYNGSNPFKAPATLNIIQHVEYNLGGYILREGMYALPKTLEQVAKKKGVSFHFDSKVDQIVIKDSKVIGIEINSHLEKFDIVVSNADVNFTYSNLLSDNKSKLAKRYYKLEPSSSAIVFFWGVNGNYDKMEIHNILFSSNYKKEFDEIFEKKICPVDPTIYIYISSKFRVQDAPEGFENWFVMINVPYNNGQNWEEEVSKSRINIINKIKNTLDITIEDKICFEKALTPVDIETRTNSNLGSIYGISSNTRNAAFLRQQNRSKKYRGLYFVGGSAHPGGGIPLVLLSGKIVTDLILKYER